MGLINAALGAAGGVMADQWKEYFYCEAIPENVMAVKGLHRVSGRSTNYKGSENVITNGSVVAVADDGWIFVKWSDGKTYNPYKFPATGDLTLEAEFRSTTAVENVSADTPAPRKIFRNGQVLILRDGKTFTTTGVEVK